mmetsp:Transcript_10586/g.29152  ORF Transcript_10586/g.29152 Transcript_10586/m.29152 type:complete len:299 (-) Transcript_10586:661-1557(-)
MRFIVSCLPRRRGECSNLPSPIPHHLFKRPLVLPPHLGLLFGCEVVLDVERCPDLLGTLALDHVRNRQAHEVEEVLDVQVVCRENQLEKPSLIPNRRKLLVPLLQLGLLLRRQFGLLSHPRLFHSVGVLLAPVHRQLQDVPPHVGERKPVRVLLVLDHVRHCLRQQRHRFLDLDFLPIGRHQCNLLFKAHPYVISSLSSLKGRTTTTVFDPFLSRFTPWRHDSACRRICRRHCLSLVGWAGRHGASRRPPPPDTTLWTWPTPWNTSGSSDPRWTTYSACRRAGRQRPAGGARGRCATV